MTRFAALVCFCICLCAAAAAAQAAPPHLVLTHLPTNNPAAQLLEVDPTTGAPQPLGRFPSDVFAPLAVTIDPCDGSPLVAVDLATGISRIVRLVPSGTGFAEFHVADLPGRATSLCIQQENLLACVDAPTGGLYRMPPRGGTPTLAYAQPNATALFHGSAIHIQFMLAWSGRPGTPALDSGVAMGITATGALWFGPATFPNPTGVDVTGIFLLPAFPPRHLLSFADGTFANFVSTAGPPQPLVPSTPIPSGGAVVLHPPPLAVFTATVLGGAPFPFLYDLDANTGVVTMRSLALPGAPVDFVHGIARGPHWVQCMYPCGPTLLTLSLSGVQQPPTTLTTTVTGPVNGNDFALFVGGLTYFAGAGLPIGLPGGCLLHVSPDAVILHQLGPSAVQSITVPGGTAFLGTILFTQWVHFGAPGLSVSGTIAFWLG